MELCNPVNMNYVFFTFTEFNLISASNHNVVKNKTKVLPIL